MEMTNDVLLVGGFIGTWKPGSSYSGRLDLGGVQDGLVDVLGRGFDGDELILFPARCKHEGGTYFNNTSPFKEGSNKLDFEGLSQCPSMVWTEQGVIGEPDGKAGCSRCNEEEGVKSFTGLAGEEALALRVHYEREGCRAVQQHRSLISERSPRPSQDGAVD